MSLRPSAASRRITVATSFALGAVAVLATACADAPTAPTARFGGDVGGFLAGPHAAISAAPAAVTALARTTPLARDIVVKVQIQPGGGNIVNIPGTDAQINFPDHFVSKPTTFTITARAGSVVAYDFQPSGSFANNPVVITQRLQNTNWAGGAVGNLQGAYVKDWSQVSDAMKTATVDEFQETTVDTRANAVIIKVWHFSGYMVSTGRN